jgi:hypothetical protein
LISEKPDFLNPPSSIDAPPLIEADDDDDDDDDIVGKCKAKSVPKEPPVNPPTSNHAFVMKCDQKLNLKPTTTVTGVAFSGLFSSHLLPPVHMLGEGLIQ